jgi:hypothetical protein
MQITHSANNLEKMASIGPSSDEKKFAVAPDENNNILVKKSESGSIGSSKQAFKGKKKTELVYPDSDSESGSDLDSDSKTIVASSDGTIDLDDTRTDDEVFEDSSPDHSIDDENSFERNDVELMDETIDFKILESELFGGKF